MSELPKLFSPIRIGKLRLKNRLVMLPMGSVFASETGAVTERTMGHFLARAEGGVGLIIVGNIVFDIPVGRNGWRHLSLDNDGLLQEQYELVEAVHARGARIAAQLNHPGRQTNLDFTRGLTPISASALPCLMFGRDPLPTPRAIERDEIDRIIELYALAARRAKWVGYDMVEIHGAHGYLVTSFMSPYMNKRTDEYGGSLENRMRFPLKLVKRVRELVGGDYPLSFRFSADEFLEGGVTLQESPSMARMLEEAGVDVIDVSAGTYETHNMMLDSMWHPEGWKLPIWEAIKRAVKAPTIAGGGLKTPGFCEHILAQGSADLIGLGRPLLADPDWPNKAAAGRLEDIRPCISCHACSAAAQLPRRGVRRCAVNAEWVREKEFARLNPAAVKKKVIVVGGGPAGMEAARIAAERGHDVTLYDRGQKLGGQLLLAARPPGKDKILWLVDFLAAQVRKQGVEVHLGAEVTLAVIRRARPDAVVIAAGATPLVPDIPGIRDRKVVTAWDVLSDRVKIADSRVAVIGGGSVGCETAEVLVEAGNAVVILEMLPAMATDMFPDNSIPLLERLSEKGVAMLTEREVKEIAPHGVICTNKADRQEQVIEADWVVLAMGARPNRELADELEGEEVAEIHVIGDCNEPRIIMEAIYEGALTGRLV